MQYSYIDMIPHGSGSFRSIFSIDSSNSKFWVTKAYLKLKQVEAYDIIVNADDLKESQAFQRTQLQKKSQLSIISRKDEDLDNQLLQVLF